MKEKWTTSNDVTSEFSFDNKFLPGSKVTAEALFNPIKGLVDFSSLNHAYTHLDLTA